LATKARGVKLGNPNLAAAQEKGVEVCKVNAEAFAGNVGPVIREIRAAGASLRQVAAALNARGIATARGGTWAATQVSDILNRETRAQEERG
jgi:Recombinase